MKFPGLKGAALALAGGIALSGCVYDPLATESDDYYGSYGYGYSYDDWGGWGYPTYGWYDGFYYPGSGAYVYDRYGTRQPWRSTDRSHWEAMQGRWRNASPADRARWRDLRERWQVQDPGARPPANVNQGRFADQWRNSPPPQPQRRNQAEQQRQNQIERQRQDQAERQRQDQAERQRQDQAERQRQDQAERQRQEQVERQRQEQVERQRQEQAERQRQEQAERQRQEQVERQRQEQVERQRQAEAEQQRQAEAERQRQEAEAEQQRNATSQQQQRMTRERAQSNNPTPRANPQQPPSTNRPRAERPRPDGEQ